MLSNLRIALKRILWRVCIAATIAAAILTTGFGWCGKQFIGICRALVTYMGLPRIRRGGIAGIFCSFSFAR